MTISGPRLLVYFAGAVVGGVIFALLDSLIQRIMSASKVIGITSSNSGSNYKPLSTSDWTKDIK